MKTWIRLIVIGTLLAGATTGSYFLFKKFMNDRTARLAGPTRPLVRKQPTSEVKTYTQKELEDARKQGKSIPGTHQPYVPNAATANDAAVQQSLRTIEEINRINQMNQRLMDQQQRNQHQNR